MKNRVYLFYGILAIGLLFLLARLFELQIIFGAKNRALAEGNRVKREILPAPRGLIYDSKERELVRNMPIYRVKKEEKEEYEVISREEALKMEARGETENLRVDIGRNYLYGEVLAHVLGYLGEANEEEVKKNQFKLGDLVGRGGIEEEYDSYLRGQDGGEIYEVDAHGEKIREIGRVEPIPGKNLYLTLDAELSQTAYEALEKKPGAVVATNPQNGQVLILISSPSFNPNNITSQNLTDESLPFFNRAVSGVYPPGSTFKIVTAAAGLEEGKVNAETTYNDTGEIRVGEYSYKNWYFTQYGRTEGVLNIVQAIKRSTDTFFYKVGEWVGPTRLAAWAEAFGLGQKTKIDLPGEAKGLVPSPDLKEKSGDRWFLGNTYHFAIGQGDLLTTPLQINLMTNVIANEGQLCQPKIREEEKEELRACQNLKLKTETINLIKEGMVGVCSAGGTAFPFFDFQPPVGCKTGTAEFGDPEERTHAWLTAFGPLENSEISVTVLMEKGGEGSAVAAPIAKKIMEKFFKND